MDRDEFAQSGEPDDLRPLTKAGQKEMKRAAKGLREEVKNIDLLATSPYTRARQTAEIVADEYDIEDVEVIDVLKPDVELEEFERWCSSWDEDKVIAIVGHEPHLGELATWLLTGNKNGSIRFKKGGACLIDFEGALSRGQGTLYWLLTTKQLTALGD
jgi:phosphohistidine phosphatase